MAFNAASLRLMAEKGLSASDIAEIAEAAEGSRSSGAERQARYRARKKTRDVTSDVTRNGNGFPNDKDILTPPVSPEMISDEINLPPVTEEHVLEAYNAMAEKAGLSKAKMTPERRKKIRTFIKRHPIDDITEAIWSVPKSRFLCGENDRGWKANLDFLLEPKKFTRLLEGSYAH